MLENNFKIENRGFLFIDLKASVEKVEQLGLIPYSKFINFCFDQLEQVRQEYPTIEVHQYAGDGVILTWKNAQTTAHAIAFFQDFLDTLETERAFLENNFSLFPTFSAAMDWGAVVESSLNGFRVFYGNTINGTARLQALCEHYKQTILIGEAALKACPELELVYLNRVYLKGMTTAMEIYGLPS